MTRKQLARIHQREFVAMVRDAHGAARLRGIVDRHWLVESIMAALPDLPEGDAYDHYLTGTHRAVRALVERFPRETQVSDQQLLPGFERIHAAYNIVRNGKLVQVPTLEMTRAEVFAKAKEIRRQGFGMLAEADELERFGEACEAQQRPEA